MKKTILFALIWVAAIACEQKEDATPQADLKVTSVPYRQLTTIETSGADLKVDLREVNDSRCPKDVVCIQMGSAKIKLTVSDGVNQAEVNVEYKGDKKADSQEFILSGQKYALSVSEVLPYPISTQTPNIEDYKVSVTIEKLK
ncbi:hypothetical protein [Dyadobacter sp. CY326]|uniref:hypothetical protein n=1 Tax=Dyadobacter sp. CY326 TaxID=2907300 RepID=UPI001F32E4A8|nr:hypothetical protein [Dyadobacter sp. CY326]MCE7065950.1 hypothetical protein [Dyadobacter sp. CY326]